MTYKEIDCNRDEQITGLENDADNVNNKILEVIRELFDACGAQSFAQILYKVRTQCVGVDSLLGGYPATLESAHKAVKDSHTIDLVLFRQQFLEPAYFDLQGLSCNSIAVWLHFE